jgi:hypothetical protein
MCLSVDHISFANYTTSLGMAKKDQRDPPHDDGEPTMPSAESRQPQLNPNVCGCHHSRASGSFGSGGEGGGESDGKLRFK